MSERETNGNGPRTNEKASEAQGGERRPETLSCLNGARLAIALVALCLMTLAPLAAFGLGPLGGGGKGYRRIKAEPTPQAGASEMVSRADSIIAWSSTTLTALNAAPPPKPSAIDFISDSVKRAEADTFLTIGGQKGAALFVPLRVLNWPSPDIVDVGLGAAGGLGKPEGLASVRVNIPQVFNAIAGTRWFAKNTTGPILPTLFLGPAVKAAWPINSFRWENDTMFLLGMPFSSIGGK